MTHWCQQDHYDLASVVSRLRACAYIRAIVRLGEAQLGLCMCRVVNRTTKSTRDSGFESFIDMTSLLIHIWPVIQVCEPQPLPVGAKISGRLQGSLADSGAYLEIGNATILGILHTCSKAET